jgi:hypothetical protein
VKLRRFDDARASLAPFADGRIRVGGHRASMRTRTILAFTAVPLVPTPGRADPTPLHVQLDTSLDPAAVVAHLADELDRAVVRFGDGARCLEPCLRVVAEGASATVTYVAPGRVWRERTVIVPAASAARLDTVVLLAGNLLLGRFAADRSDSASCRSCHRTSLRSGRSATRTR